MSIYILSNGNEVIECANLHKLSFNIDALQDIFKKKIDKIIFIEVLIEGLNPRPQSLLNDLNTTSRLISSFAQTNKLDLISLA